MYMALNRIHCGKELSIAPDQEFHPKDYKLSAHDVKRLLEQNVIVRVSKKKLDTSKE